MNGKMSFEFKFNPKLSLPISYRAANQIIKYGILIPSLHSQIWNSLPILGVDDLPYDLIRHPNSPLIVSLTVTQ